MEKRKSISKKIRFEVFKRDKFTCQYCGRTSPDVILQVDHIVPVAKGGKNNIMNLVTSCIDCNLGKGARELSDDSVIKKQQQQLENLADRNEQLEMMLKWKEELQQITENEINAINTRIVAVSNSGANENGKTKIKAWLRKYPVDLIMDAVDIAFEKYYYGTGETWEIAFDKIGGICHNKTRKNAEQIHFLNYLKKSCKAKFGYVNDKIIADIVKNYIHDENDFEDIKYILNTSRTMTDFTDQVWEEFA